MIGQILYQEPNGEVDLSVCKDLMIRLRMGCHAPFLRDRRIPAAVHLVVILDKQQGASR